ncbi:MAG: hypothetical protein IPM76_23235, partial [Chloroflexi bacterium]|nr:hypothetical protein [Chloroflexota bacterium]
LYRWLGVRAQPDAADLVAALTAISQQTGDQDAPLPPTVLAQVTRCWALGRPVSGSRRPTAASLTPLHGRAVIPNSRGMLVREAHLFPADDAALVAQFAGGPDGPAAICCRPLRLGWAFGRRWGTSQTVMGAAAQRPARGTTNARLQE